MYAKRFSQIENYCVRAFQPKLGIANCRMDLSGGPIIRGICLRFELFQSNVVNFCLIARVGRHFACLDYLKPSNFFNPHRQVSNPTHRIYSIDNIQFSLRQYHLFTAGSAGMHESSNVFYP